MIKVIIVDFYGVLYSNFDWSKVDERIYRDEGRSQKFAYLKNLANKGKITNQEFRIEVAKLARDKDFPQEPAVLTKPAINASLIRTIKQYFPRATLVLLSNGNHRDVLRQLDECGFSDEFALILTSSNMRFIKPQQGAYVEVFKKLDVSPDEVVIIDDSPGHTAATREYGYKTIRYIDNKDLAVKLSQFADTSESG